MVEQLGARNCDPHDDGF